MNIINVIRQNFSKPRTVADGMGGGYCVGGAICLYAHGHSMTPTQPRTFPSNVRLAHVLRDLNPRLTYDAAYGFAHDIITYNDDENFDAAWQIAVEAMQEE